MTANYRSKGDFRGVSRRQGETVGVFTLMDIQIATKKAKISSTSKAGDMSDNPRLGLFADTSRVSPLYF